MADDELRRRERQARLDPGDPEARARLAAARSRAGDTPSTPRLLQALERGARAHEEPGGRGAALAEVAWGFARQDLPEDAIRLAREAVAAAERGRPEPGLIGLVRSGAALARAGRREEGLGLLSRTAERVVADPRSASVGALLLGCADAGLSRAELSSCLRTPEELACALGRILLPVAELAPHLAAWGLVEPVTQGLSVSLERGDLYQRNAAVERLAVLGTLTPELASGFLGALLRDPVRATAIGFCGEPIDTVTTTAIGLALRVSGLEPIATLQPAIERLRALGRHPAAVTLGAVLLRARAHQPDTGFTVAACLGLLDEASRLGDHITRDAAGRPVVVPALLLARGLDDVLAASAAAEPLSAEERLVVLRRGLELLPEAIFSRCEVLGAVGAGAARLGPPGFPLLRETARLGLTLLESPASWREPRWLAFEALEPCAEAAGAHQDGPALLEEIAAAASRVPSTPSEHLASRYFAGRALCACALTARALGEQALAARCRSAAVAHVNAQHGQDLCDAVAFGARSLARDPEPSWRLEGALELADACAAGPREDPRQFSMGLSSAFALLVALLDPP